MSIPNEREIKNSEVRQESYTDINGNTQTNLTQTTETVKNNTANPNSYTNGYVQGRNVERSYQQADLAQRDENNASGGLLLGIIITSLLGLVIGGVWYFNQQNNAAVNNAVPVVVPVPSKSNPTPSASPQPPTTIIERTREVPVPVAVPVPQQQAAPRQPDINITIPPQQPAAEKAPSVTQPTPKAAQNPATSPTTNTPTSQNDSSGTKSDSSKTTPPQGVDQSNSTSNSGSSTAGDATTGN
ncbi:hypothetical protein [Nostoc sp.]|uniref:hypothetical protein n=1 Tax=Nostoc sp. TaxID=1180 RepID=UPI002FEF7579